MRVVGLDTSSNLGSIALWSDGALIEEAALEPRDGFGTVLFPSLEALLQRHGLAVKDVDRWAAASGPGSFTGVRIGLTAVKGLAEAFGRSAHGISNLRALAWHGRGERRAAVLDARRSEIYGAVYDSELRMIGDEVVAPLSDWLVSVPSGADFIVQDANTFAAQLPGMVTEVRRLAGAIAWLAAAEEGRDPITIDANYVRRSDAELHWRE